jgi:hypothetical protein
LQYHIQIVNFDLLHFIFILINIHNGYITNIMNARKAKLPVEIVVTTEKPILQPGMPWSGYIDPKHIKANPKQPRKVFPEEDQVSLQLSHSEVGQQRAVYVIPFEDPENPEIWFMIHDGERSWRSLTTLNGSPVLVTYNPIVRMEDITFLSFVANFGGRGHTHNEIIDAVWDEVKVNGRSIKNFADAVTRSIAWVGDYLMLHNLLPEIRVLLDSPTPKKNRLPLGVAKIIAKAKQDEQQAIYQRLAGKKTKVAVREARASVTEEIRVGGRARGPGDDKKIVMRIVGTLDEDLTHLLSLHPSIFDSPIFDLELLDAYFVAILAKAIKAHRIITKHDLPTRFDPDAAAKLIARRHAHYEESGGGAHPAHKVIRPKADRESF